MARTEREKRYDKLVGAAETIGKLAKWRRFKRNNLNVQGLPKRKGWPQCHKVSSCWQGCQSCLCQKEEDHSHLSRTPDREMEKSRGRR